MEIFDLEGKKIYETASPGTGVVTAELIADTKYEVIIKNEKAEHRRFAFLTIDYPDAKQQYIWAFPTMNRDWQNIKMMTEMLSFDSQKEKDASV